MIPLTPPSPFKKLNVTDGSITLDTQGKIIVVPTGSPYILALNNEYTLDSRRLTIAQSPFGGVNGLIDYCPGSVHVTTGDGIYLTDVAGNNSSKDLPAGMLSRLGYLTVDTVAHSMTQEITIVNTNPNNNPLVIDACDATTGWSFAFGSGTLSINSGLVGTGTTNPAGNCIIKKTFSLNLSSYYFIVFSITSTLAGNLYLWVKDTLGVNPSWDSTSRFAIAANTATKFVLPLRSTAGNTGTMPRTLNGTLNLTSIAEIGVGITTVSGNSPITVTVSPIYTDVAKSAYIELQIPNNLAATSSIIQCYAPSAYAECRRDSLDGTFSNISATTANMKMLDETKFDDVYGSGLGRAYFPKGSSGVTVSGSSGTMTYSANKGTGKRIGIRVDLPPSDGGRTNFNKVRLKVTMYYTIGVDGHRSASYIFSNDNNAVTGLQNMSKPWIAIYDPTTKYIDFYLYQYRPKSLSFNRDETGLIYSVTLNPGNGNVYHGRIFYPDLTLDSNTNNIPNVFEATVNGSLTKFLQNYGMMI